MDRVPAGIRLLLAAAPAFLTANLLLGPNPLLAKTLVSAVLTVTLWDPASGLLLTAGLAPIGGLFATLGGIGNLEPLRLSEAVVVAFVAAWLLRPTKTPAWGPTIPPVMAAAAWLLVVTVVTSIAGVAYHLRSHPVELRLVLGLAGHDYYRYHDPIGLADSARLLEGLALVAATIGLFRHRPALAVRLPVVLTSSGVVVVGAAIVGARLPDRGAAASYLALVACVAVGMGARERGPRRALWAGAALLCGILVAVTFSAEMTRSRMAEDETSLRMIAARPMFGVGVGQYHTASAILLSPRLAWTGASGSPHDDVLRIASETGLVGFALFAAWLGAGVMIAGRALSRAPRDYRLLGLLAGTVAFLCTCLRGQPLRVPDVTLPFWIAFGLLLALAGSVLLNVALEQRGPLPRARTPLAVSLSAAVVAVCVIASVPVSALRGPLDPLATAAGDGFYRWETGPDGLRFRLSGAYASFFAPSEATRAEIPVRAPRKDGINAPTAGEVAIGGVVRSRFVADERWSTVTVALPDVGSLARFKRIDLKMDRPVQIGECHFGTQPRAR